MSNYFDEGHKKSQIDTRRMTESEGNESEIILWLKENKLCGKNDCILNIFRENIDYNLPINDFIELLDTNNLKEFLEAINIPKPSIILISSKIKQIKKLKKQNTNQDNDEIKQDISENVINNTIKDAEIVDLNFEWKFPKREQCIDEFLDILLSKNIVWKKNKQHDSYKTPPYEVHDTAHIDNKKICKYDVPIGRSIIKIDQVKVKKSLVEAFQHITKNIDCLDAFFRWKRPTQIIHSFNEFERIYQAQVASTSLGSDRDFVFYTTWWLLDAVSNKLLSKDKYLIKNKEIYSINDKKFSSPLNVKFVYICRSLMKKDKHNRGLYDNKCSRAFQYRSGWCAEKCKDLSLKITTIFEYNAGGSWIAQKITNSSHYSVYDCIVMGEKIRSFFLY
eukprot:40882_1